MVTVNFHTLEKFAISVKKYVRKDVYFHVKKDVQKTTFLI